MSIVVRAPRPERRRLQRMVRRPADCEEGRRAMAILRLMDGRAVSEVATMVESARSSVYRWVGRYQSDGLSGLATGRRGRQVSTVTETLKTRLRELLATTPQSLGYLRSTWSSELLAKALGERFALTVHASTIRRLLLRLGYRWGRARPTLHKRDPRKAEKLEAIQNAIDTTDPYTEVFFVDEADVDLNPRIGFGWRARGAQDAIPTPGKNRKHYVAGALHAHTGRLVWVEHEAKTTALFIKLLEAVRATYRRAQRIVFILDNYIIHKACAVQRWLRNNPKFELVFQPVYHPWVNRIERLWRAMHDTVTRNHRCKDMTELCSNVTRFFEVVQPFPGAGHGVAHLRSAI
ncbi:MAG: IS630 family transposase [Chromatiales bacterium]|nr:IS630 family transposase [Chromatiales bacterium]